MSTQSPSCPLLYLQYLNQYGGDHPGAPPTKHYIENSNTTLKSLNSEKVILIRFLEVNLTEGKGLRLPPFPLDGGERKLYPVFLLDRYEIIL